jgi:hypothetical protein
MPSQATEIQPPNHKTEVKGFELEKDPELVEASDHNMPEL